MQKTIPLKHSIVIPFVPPSLNVYARYNRWEMHECHAIWKQAVWSLCNESGNRMPRPCKRIEIKADLYFIQKRRRDETNYSATLWKLLLDGLVITGIIPDDTAQFVKVANDIKMIDDGEREKTVVHIDCYLS